MKRSYTLVLLFASMLLLSLAACKKEAKSNVTLQLSATDSNKTINVAYGEKILITLRNPGDGGFSFDTWQYNSSVLKLGAHTHSSSVTNAVGDFGTDTWEFDAIASGKSQLLITGSRSTESITMFRTTVQVK